MTKLTEQEQTEVQQSYDKLMSSLSPEIAAEVQRKFDIESKAFSEAAKKACPSQEPKFWAKRSCNRCHGTGKVCTRLLIPPHSPYVKDKTNVNYMPVKCSCSDKNYTKWLAEYRRQYNKEKEEGKHE
jgi:hypothetical protein